MRRLTCAAILHWVLYGLCYGQAAEKSYPDDDPRNRIRVVQTIRLKNPPNDLSMSPSGQTIVIGTRRGSSNGARVMDRSEIEVLRSSENKDDFSSIASVTLDSYFALTAVSDEEILWSNPAAVRFNFIKGHYSALSLPVATKSNATATHHLLASRHEGSFRRITESHVAFTGLREQIDVLDLGDLSKSFRIGTPGHSPDIMAFTSSEKKVLYTDGFQLSVVALEPDAISRVIVVRESPDPHLFLAIGRLASCESGGEDYVLFSGRQKGESGLFGNSVTEIWRTSQEQATSEQVATYGTTETSSTVLSNPQAIVSACLAMPRTDESRRTHFLLFRDREIVIIDPGAPESPTLWSTSIDQYGVDTRFADDTMLVDVSEDGLYFVTLHAADQPTSSQDKNDGACLVVWKVVVD
jgi:hypothetical protein